MQYHFVLDSNFSLFVCSVYSSRSPVLILLLEMDGKTLEKFCTYQEGYVFICLLHFIGGKLFMFGKILDN